LLPLDERWRNPEVEVVETGTATRGEALELGIIPEEGFLELVEGFWRELAERVGVGGRIDYWDWVGADTYQETVYRAYMSVFVVGYGYANAEWDMLKEETIIIHNPEPRPDPGRAKVSLPVMVDYEEWRRWRKE
jgi:hypothetical protein